MTDPIDDRLEREGRLLAFRLDSIMTALTETDEDFRRDKRLMERKWNIDIGPTRISLSRTTPANPDHP